MTPTTKSIIIGSITIALGVLILFGTVISGALFGLWLMGAVAVTTLKTWVGATVIAYIVTAIFFISLALFKTK